MVSPPLLLGAGDEASVLVSEGSLPPAQPLRNRPAANPVDLYSKNLRLPNLDMDVRL